MRSPNPYSPDFGNPHLFFGRERYLAIVRRAMESGAGPDRSLLVEGVRGSGKTALLGRLREYAEEMGWDAVYVGSRDAASEIAFDVRHLPTARRRPDIVDAALSLGGIAPVSIRKGAEDRQASLRQTLLEHLRHTRRGMLLLIDEMQRISQDDAQSVCEALNAARQQGFPVVFVMAGLPGTQRRLGTFDGCTFMARSSRMFLTLLTVDETMDAVNSSLDLVEELSASEKVRTDMGAFTMGHPYLLQLVGYDLYRQVEAIVDADPSEWSRRRVPITGAMLERAEDYAYRSYATKILDLVFRRFGDGTKAYLRELAKTMDETGSMTSGNAIARALGKESGRDVSAYRRRMLDAGILEEASHGHVRFRIPYIPRYLAETEPFQEDNRDDTGVYFPVR